MEGRRPRAPSIRTRISAWRGASGAFRSRSSRSQPSTTAVTGVRTSSETELFNEDGGLNYDNARSFRRWARLFDEVSPQILSRFGVSAFTALRRVSPEYFGWDCRQLKPWDLEQEHGKWKGPRGRALLCVMGPLVPWEWGWYLAHGEGRKAFARWAAAAARHFQGRGILWEVYNEPNTKFWKPKADVQQANPEVSF